MDSKTETVSDNELIAQFMGFVQSKSSLGNTWEHPERMGIYGGVGLKLKYDTSWDWLMPVVEKIQMLDEPFSITLGYAHMSNLGISSHYAYCHVENWKGEELVGNSGRPTLIETVYTTVVDFIKWYNSQSPDTIK